MTGFTSTLAAIWRLAIPYFRSEDRWPGRILFAALILIELLVVAINVMFNQWNAKFYNALQQYNWDEFVHQLSIFCVLATAFIILAVYQLYLNQWLRIRWRQWMTARYLDRWLNAANHYRMQLQGDRADNPDQRIAEDIAQFVEYTLSIVIGLLGAIVSLASFIVILWGLSAAAPLRLFGIDWNIPGYLVWVAIIYATIGTLLTHLVGRPLIGLYFNQQRFEADFRFNLVRARENSEQIALMRGEAAERGRLMTRFGSVVGNWRQIMSRNKTLTFLTSGYGQISAVFPIVVVSPAYFAKVVPLGGLTQTASAFNAVQGALSFFVNAYRLLAEWRAVVQRLSGFDAAIAKAEATATCPPVVSVVTKADAPDLHIGALDVRLPNGAPLVSVSNAGFAAGDHTLVTGASGSGKSTLFRAIGGIWPFGDGTIVVPEGARVMVLPQRPYLPVGSLMAAVSYPAVPGTFDAQRIRDVLNAVGLPALAARLDEEQHWDHILSLGEEQRVAVARAILHAPDYLFLDEATASLDEPAEAALYRLLHERIPRTTVISIGHRSTLRAFHRRHLELAGDANHRELREVSAEPVA